MKNGWQANTLGQMCQLISGRHIDAKDYNTDSRGVGYLTGPSDFGSVHPVVSKWTEFPIVKANAGDILITVKGSGVGKINLLDLDEIAISRQLMAVRVSGANPRYVYLFLSSTFDHFQSASTGAAIPGISRDQVLGLIIPTPPLPEQRRIVAILDEAFDAIATAKVNTEKNLQNARALFESHAQSVFTQRGEGWVETTVDKISTNLDSKRVPITKNVRTSGEYPYYGASGIVDYVGDYIFEGDRLLVSEDGANLLARSSPIAFSVSGKYWVNNHAHILKFDDIATQRFVEFYLESIKLDEYITGAAQPKLNQKALNSIPIPIPTSVQAQAKVVETVESLQEETQRLAGIYERKLAALEALKKSMLHQAFSGQLTAEETVEAVTATVPFPATLPNISTADLHAGILAMACQLHEVKGKAENFAHVKAEKIAHMIEARLGIDLGRKPVKDAAGPNDFNHLKKVEHRALKTNCFDFRRVSGGAYRVQKLGGFDRLIEKTRTALGERCADVDRLLQWMLPMKWQQAEIVATVFAAWNNLLLDGKQPTDEQIVYESRENWHPEKMK
ncbi:MAG TPA: restriction endonuclease subunit S, partial [Tepidisphaeraceae bacterium]